MPLRYLSATAISFILGGVGAQTVPALARRNEVVLCAVFFRQGADLLQKYFFESSCKFHHYLQRKPIRQLHLKKGFMITVDVEVVLVSQDHEELPTDWAAEL